MQAHIDLTTFIVIAIVVVCIASLVAFVGPKLNQAADVAADIANAGARSDARIAQENARAFANADAIKAQAEISKTNAAANAYALQKQADTDLIKAQSAARVNETNAQSTTKVNELNAQTNLVKASEDAQTTRNLITGMIALVSCIIIAVGANFVLPQWFTHRKDTKEIEARKVLMLAAINQTQSGAIVSVALDNRHSFKIERPAALPASVPNAPQLGAPSVGIDTPLPIQNHVQEVGL